MAEETIISRKDVNALAGKLQKFAEGLPHQEQEVLGWVLARARMTSETELSESDLEAASGGATGAPMSNLLADAAGLDTVAAPVDTISVGWSHSF